MNDPSSVEQPRPFSRREFITATTVSAVSLATAIPAAPAAAKDAIDAHSHVWTPDTTRYPLDAGSTPADMKPSSFTPEELLAHARPAGVARVVLIQPRIYRFDNRYMIDCLQRFPGVFSAVGIVDENAPKAPDRMRELARQGVRGFRVTPGQQDPGPWLESAGMAAMWKAAADQKLSICPLINPNALPHLDRMCGRFPNTTVVIDHIARIGGNGEFPEADMAALGRLARFPHVYVKVSALSSKGRKQSPYTDLGPAIRRLVADFGAQRLMWGTDCPYQVMNGHTYVDSIALIRDRLDFLSAGDREWMIRKAAEKVFFAG